MTAAQEGVVVSEAEGCNKNVAAERAVLAGLYLYGIDAYLDIAPMLSPMSFTDRSNQAIYKCFSYLFEESNFY